ncbi:hypothetical protein DICSQDRAFT_106259 [Dichomitus squalens LYAD-421 SS1]|uniref:BTB domain-containing protein n=1 Tax=Dichomitus squalens (strain LYAD-421) TaxID=732165 RepID=R7SZS0_DICSQ|nr:uncharacterized protein DICSQDRAFT_106259 [Dichomitus squalens LYAD-421 SS1]EJF61195.1 hypothetical protein DICSQDRAFT_106259 [Dichomitus squalens LYAD-421 SS1]
MTSRISAPRELVTSMVQVGRPLRNLPKRSAGNTPADMPAAGKCRHSDYCFDDGNVVLECQGTLYKVHRSLLERHSPVFREMFMLPQPEGSIEGLSEENPITLEGIEADDFTRLLSLLYPPVLGDCKITTVEEWMSIFEQADRWQIDCLRDKALGNLRMSYISPIPKILFWMRFRLPEEDIVQPFIDLIARPNSLSLSEAQAVGLKLLVKIACARDMARDEGLCPHSGGFSVRRDEALSRIVHEVFYPS